MPANQILKIAGNNDANVVSQAQFEALAALFGSGFTAGIVPSSVMNKVLRQSSLVAAAVAQFIADNQGSDVLDTLSAAALSVMLGQSVSNRASQLLADTGTANAYVGATNPATTSYANGFLVRFRPSNTNSGASTLNAGAGAKSLRNINGSALASGDLPSGSIVTAVYVQALDQFLLAAPAQTVTIPTGDARYVRNSDMAGAVEFFARSSAPAGWLKANGANVSRANYPDLFTAIGTTWGAGDGSTTFTLPDLRGEFLRGWDDGRGIDSGRAFASAQSATGIGSYVAPTGAITSTEADSTDAVGLTYFSIAGGLISGSYIRVRPRNRALLACIKF